MKILTYRDSGVSCWLIETAGGWVLVDTGYRNSFGGFRRFLRKSGVKADEIRAVLLTDTRAAQAGFLHDVMNMTRADVFCSGKGLSVLLSGRDSISGMAAASPRLQSAYRKEMKKETAENTFVPPAIWHRSRIRTVEDLPVRSALFRDFGVRVLETPGHTASSVAYFFDSGEIFCGETAVNTFGTAHHIPELISDRDALVRSWQALISISGGTLYPARGRAFAASSLRHHLHALKKVTLYEI